MTELLSGYRLWCHSDVEELRDALAQASVQLRYDPLPHRDTAGPMVLNAVEMGTLDVCYVAHGRPARVHYAEVDEPVEPYTIAMLPLAGRFTIRSGTVVTAADARTAAFLDRGAHLDLDVDFTIEPNTEFITVRIGRGELEAQLAKLLGHPPTSRLHLTTGLDVNTPAVRSWASTIHMLCRDLDGPRGLTHPKLSTPIQQVVISQLLTALPTTDSPDLAALHDPTPPLATPRLIRRADQLITDHAHEALTVADIAEAVGISVRTLQEGFRRHLDTTPTARLRHARLAGAHAALRAADPHRHTVATIAHDWGFTHLGRFAHAYRHAYGEHPSHTLRH